MTEWISVKDSVPGDCESNNKIEHYESVFICFHEVCDKCDNIYEMGTMAIGYFDGRFWRLTEPFSEDCLPNNTHSQMLVTHWMPLPEPPK